MFPLTRNIDLFDSKTRVKPINLNSLSSTDFLVFSRIPKIVQELAMPRDELDFVKIIGEIVELSESYGNENAIDALCYMITVARDEKIKIYAINEIHKMKNR